jgi:hypothetical protein
LACLVQREEIAVAARGNVEIAAGAAISKRLVGAGMPAFGLPGTHERVISTTVAPFHPRPIRSQPTVSGLGGQIRKGRRGIPKGEETVGCVPLWLLSYKVDGSFPKIDRPAIRMTTGGRPPRAYARRSTCPDSSASASSPARIATSPIFLSMPYKAASARLPHSETNRVS